MAQDLAIITLVVKDYNEALNFYIYKLGFQLNEDSILTKDKRWILISKVESKGSQILLAKANDKKQLEAVGNQTGGRVTFSYTQIISSRTLTDSQKTEFII